MSSADTLKCPITRPSEFELTDLCSWAYRFLRKQKLTTTCSLSFSGLPASTTAAYKIILGGLIDSLTDGSGLLPATSYI